MVRYFCKICGKEINMKEDGVTFSFHSDNVYAQNEMNEEDHLCTTCTRKVKAFIRDSAENK